jgi:hypothetical protein
MAEQEGFNVETFKAYVLENGLMRNNRFLARFFIPVGLRADADVVENARQLEYWGENIVLPGLHLNIHPNNRYGYGMAEKKPDRAIVQDTRATFYGDAEGAIWETFNQWMKLIVNTDMQKGITGQTGYNRYQPYVLSYKDDYTATIEITVFDDYGDAKLVVNLRDAYPISIGDIALDWNDNSTIMRIPVFFTFMDYNYRRSREDDKPPANPPIIA